MILDKLFDNLYIKYAARFSVSSPFFGPAKGMHLKQTLLTALAVSAVGYAGSESSTAAACKCGPTDKCWPSAAKWAALNSTVNGRLIKTIPIGSVCHTTTVVDSTATNTFDATKCADVQANWHFPQVSCLFPVHTFQYSNFFDA